jgi:peptidoglycan hydrolase-like protein with peptidoglycan-binding domain
MSDDSSVKVEIHLPTLRKGDGPHNQPNVVARLQRMLNDRGLGPLVEDGDFGPKTEAAVKTFQGNEGIGTDGVVGAHTWGALLNSWLLSSEAC